MTPDTFDYVIVGGGTAGLVLANRLTENEDVTVAVIEAGADLSADPRISTPALFPTLLGSEADWNLQSEPQEGLKGKKVSIPSGRVLGGSSAINGQAFIATSKAGVDAWENLGNTGWNYDTLAPYFRKCHTFNKPQDQALQDHLSLRYIDQNISGSDGPLQLSFPDVLDNPLPKAWIDSFNALGLGISGDPFSGRDIGAYISAASIDPINRERSYAVNAYLKPVKERKNLTVTTNAKVRKILFDDIENSPTASGVEYVKDGETISAKASREIIVSAGTFHSPKILELSGVGSKPLLESLGIPVIVNNEQVGENLQEQPVTGISFEVKDEVQTMDDLLRQNPAAMQSAMEQYGKSKSGPLSAAGIFMNSYLSLLGLVSPEHHDALKAIVKASNLPTDSHPISNEHADFVKNLSLDPQEGTGQLFGYAAQVDTGEGSGGEIFNERFLPGGFFTVAAILLQPLSRGYVHARSSNLDDAVRIDPRFLTHPLDMEAFARLVGYISKVVETEPLKSLLKPGGLRNRAAPPDLNDIDALREYIRSTTLSAWHATGTCSMLPREKGGVVDSNLRVYGAKNLRVVDASVIPITPRGNPQSSVYAVAERAADLIKRDQAA